MIVDEEYRTNNAKMLGVFNFNMALTVSNANALDV